MDNDTSNIQPQEKDPTETAEQLLAALSLFTPPPPARNPYGRFRNGKKTAVTVIGEAGEILEEETDCVNTAASHFNVGGHTPFGAVSTPASTEGKPVKSIITKNSHTRLVYAHNIGELAIYTSVDITPHAKTEHVHEVRGKLVSGPATSKEFASNTDEPSVVTKKKYRSQNKVMGKSAKDVTRTIFALEKIDAALEDMDFDEEEKTLIKEEFEAMINAEWTHLGDYDSYGEAVQVPEKIVYANSSQNSLMMAPERYLKHRKAKGENIVSACRAIDIQSEVPRVIEMYLQRKNGKCYKLTFDPLGTVKPIKQTLDYFYITQELYSHGIIDPPAYCTAERFEETVTVTTPVHK